MELKDGLMYCYMPNAYSRDSINIGEWLSLLGNLSILEQKQTTSIWKRFRYFSNRNFNCTYLD